MSAAAGEFSGAASAGGELSAEDVPAGEVVRSVLFFAEREGFAGFLSFGDPSASGLLLSSDVCSEADAVALDAVLAPLADDAEAALAAEPALATAVSAAEAEFEGALSA